MKSKPNIALFNATDELITDFKKLCDLTLDNLTLFLTTFKTKDHFEFEDNQLEQFVLKTKIDAEKLSSITAVTKFLFRRFAEYKLGDDEIWNELCDIASRGSFQLDDSKKELLVSLFQTTEKYRAELSSFPFLSSVIPTLRTITPIIDIRTIYKEIESGTLENDSKTDVQIASFAPVAILRFLTEDDKENKSQIIIQADKETLEKTIEVLTKYLERLKSIETIVLELNNKVQNG